MKLKNPKDYNAGKYKIVASNGVGEPTVASVSVFIYPILPTIVLETEKSIYKPESEATVTCKIKGLHKLISKLCIVHLYYVTAL